VDRFYVVGIKQSTKYTNYTKSISLELKLLAANLYGENATGTALVAKGLNGSMSGMQSVVRISHASLVYRL